MNKNLEKFNLGLKNNSTFLLIDLEANAQGDGDFKTSDIETIQIGYVIFDFHFNLIKRGSIFIKPINNPTLSEFIKNLTGIKQEQVNDGISFNDGLGQIISLLKEYKCSFILSYGNYDMKQLYSDCQINKIEYPFFEGDERHSKRHINIKNAIASKLNIKEKGMARLMEYLGLELEGKHHDGEDDCINIFKIIKQIFKKL